MKDIMDTISKLIPFLQSSPTWLQYLVSIWLVFTVFVFLAFLFGRSQTKAPEEQLQLNEKQKAESKIASSSPAPQIDDKGLQSPQGQPALINNSSQPTIYQAGRDIVIHPSQPQTKPQKSDTNPPVTQTMINSPGGIQAGGNVTINQGPQTRKLSAEERTRFVGILAQAPKANCEIEVPSDDSEAIFFAKEISHAVNVSGWEIEAFANSLFPVGSTPQGIEISTFAENQKASASALQRAFQSVGITIKLHSYSDSKRPLHILIGTKP